MLTNTDDTRRCPFSHALTAGRHLTGDGTLRGHCPGCGRQYVPADALTPGDDTWWTLLPHTPLHDDWPTRSLSEHGGWL